MNTRIEAGSMSLSISALLPAPKISVQNNTVLSNFVPTWTRFNFTTISINGHSLKSVNPELKVGELATL